MELITLAAVAILWAMVGPLIALSRANSLGRQISALRAQVTHLQLRLDAAAAPAAPLAGAAREPTPTTADIAVPAPAAIIDAISAPAEESEPPTPDVTGPWEQEAAAGAAPPAPPTSRRKRSLEGEIGGRWSVLVGGLAVALGAVFLVRFSIEQGLLGPAMRIALGALLSAALLLAGEVMRRRDRRAGAPAFRRADVPAVLTGAGAVAAFATVYAAYALYGFLGDGPAFVLLTAVGLATLTLSAVHGPALAALGALASYGTPFLVSSEAPAVLPLVLHLLAVTGSVLGIGRLRGWRWLQLAGIAAGLGWGVLIAGSGLAMSGCPEVLLVLGLAALAIVVIVAGVESIALRDRPPNWLAVGSLSGIAALSVLFSAAEPDYPVLTANLVLIAALAAAGSRWPAVSLLAIVAGVLAVLTTMLLRVPVDVDTAMGHVFALEWAIVAGPEFRWLAGAAAALALMTGVGGYLTADRAAAEAPRTAGAFAPLSAGAPLLILVVVHLRHAPFETRPGFGLVALVLAALLAAAAERTIRRRLADLSAPAPAFFAAGATLSLSFAMAVGLSPAVIPLALALGAGGVAWVYRLRAVPALPWLALGSAALACVALIADPRLSVDEIGVRPILNGLILHYGLPALAVLAAGEIARKTRDGIAAALLQTIGLVLAAVFVVLEIRHAANGGIIDAGAPGLAEQSALTLAALAFSAGLQRIAARAASGVYAAASLVAGLLSAASIAFAHFVALNPVFTSDPVGEGAVVNLLLPGYLLPALAAAWIVHSGRGVRPAWYLKIFAVLSLALGFAYVTLMVRHGFHGSDLGGPTVLDAENWTYSAVWLVLGIGLLAAGVLWRSLPLRAASGLVLAIVCAKVFLLDMSELTGVLRAASFLGLGAVLIVIGRLYQTWLLRRAPAAAEPG